MAVPLKTARLKNKLTQAMAASSLGIDQGHYSRIERGEVRPSVDLARKIVAYFGGTVALIEILAPGSDSVPTEIPA